MFLDTNPSLVDDVKLLRLRAKAREIFEEQNRIERRK
jgi:hypothetical protein